MVWSRRFSGLETKMGSPTTILFMNEFSLSPDLREPVAARAPYCYADK